MRYNQKRLVQNNDGTYSQIPESPHSVEKIVTFDSNGVAILYVTSNSLVGGTSIFASVDSIEIFEIGTGTGGNGVFKANAGISVDLKTVTAYASKGTNIVLPLLVSTQVAASSVTAKIIVHGILKVG